jgi:nickel transport protein
MTRLLLIICAALAATLCLSAASNAHKVNIFAYVEGNTVVTESGYSRSSRVNKGVVEVHDAASGELLLTGTTDEQGNFSFEVPDKAREQGLDLQLLVKAGVGHQGDWVVKAEEYMVGDAPAAEAETSTAQAETASDAAPAAAPAQAVIVAAPKADIAAVEAVVKRELEPVKRMLADMSQPGPSVTEILGGIGYIFGLFGVAAYFKSRK